MIQMTEWKYGDAWEEYPISEGEIWANKASGSMISVHDIRNQLPDYMMRAEMIYCDSPWSKGNANAFITKAGMDNYINDFNDFMDVLFGRIDEISPKVCYLEIGKQHLGDFKRRMNEIFPEIQVWEIKYYKKNVCYLVRGGYDICSYDYIGMDDEETPLAAIEYEHPLSVADLCTGRGLTMLAAHKYGATFYGTELNKRRLAVAIERAERMGVHYEKYNI